MDLEERAERAKISLSQQQTVRVSLPAGGKTQSVELTQEEYYKAIEPDILQMLACVDRAFGTAGKRPADMESVILTGAPNYSPYLQERFNKHLGVKGKLAGDPALTVAEGAALHAVSLGSGDRSIPEKFANRTEHDLGVAVLEDNGNGKHTVCAVIVPEGTSFPCDLPAKLFRLEHDNQTECVFEFYQGKDGADVRQCSPIGSTTLNGLPPETMRSQRIQIGGSISPTSTVEFIVTDLVSGKSARTSVRLSGVKAGKAMGAP